MPERGDTVCFVYLSGHRLYTVADKTLYVYSMSDHTYPIATYRLVGTSLSGMIIDNRLYLGSNNLQVFKVSTSLTQSLTPVTEITTEFFVYKILRVGNELLLG